MSLPRTELAARSEVTLPLFPHMTEADQDRVVGALAEELGVLTVSWTLPLTDVKLSEEDVAAYLGVLESGWLTMGPRTSEFETVFAERFGVPHAVAVSSGTAALHLALLAAGVGQGDEVLVPAGAFVAGAAAIRYCGAHPVLVESIGPEDLNLDPRDAQARVTPRTRAVLATHWLGYACDLEALERLCARHGLILIEDCAQSIAARDTRGRLTGTVGHGRMLLVLLQEAAGGR